MDNPVVKINECFECGSKGELLDHHVIPRSQGGKKTVKLCDICHSKAHNLPDYTFSNHSDLVKNGLKKVRENGIKLGRPLQDFPYDKVAALKIKGLSESRIAKILDLSLTTLNRRMKNKDGESSISRREDVSKRIKDGIERRRRSGKHIGRNKTKIDILNVWELRCDGCTWKEVQLKTGFSKSTVYRRMENYSRWIKSVLEISQTSDYKAMFCNRKAFDAWLSGESAQVFVDVFTI